MRRVKAAQLPIALGVVLAVAFLTSAGQSMKLIVPAELRQEENLVGGRAMYGSLHRPLNAQTVYSVQSTLILKCDLETGIFETVVGSGLPGNDDGFGRNAKFRNLKDFVFLPDKETMIVAQGGPASSIRRLNITSREVRTIAGSNSGFVDGSASVAKFNDPLGLAIHKTESGYTIIVADAVNHAIRLVDYETGETTTLAGFTGTSGYTDGAAVNVTFNTPMGLALFPDNTRVVVADAHNHVLRVVWLHNGTTYTLSGAGSSGYANGAASSTLFETPTDVAFISGSELLVADFFNNIVRLVHGTTGASSLFAGVQGVGASVAEDDFGRPEAITILDGGAVAVVSDSFRDRVQFLNLASREISVPDQFRPLPGNQDGVGKEALFRQVVGIDWANDGTFGVVYDSLTSTLKRVDTATRAASNLYTSGTVDSVVQMSLDDRFVYFHSNYQLLAFELESSTATRITGQAGVTGYVDGNESAVLLGNNINWMAATPDGEALIWVESEHSAIRIANLTTGHVRTLIGGTAGQCTVGPAETVQLDDPRGLAVTADGARVLFADSGCLQIRQLHIATGLVSWFALYAGEDDGPADSSGMYGPTDLVLAPGGKHVILNDRDNYRIRAVDVESGFVVTLKLDSPFGRDMAFLPVVGGYKMLGAAREGVAVFGCARGTLQFGQNISCGCAAGFGEATSESGGCAPLCGDGSCVAGFVRVPAAVQPECCVAMACTIN